MLKLDPKKRIHFVQPPYLYFSPKNYYTNFCPTVQGQVSQRPLIALKDCRIMIVGLCEERHKSSVQVSTP